MHCHQADFFFPETEINNEEAENTIGEIQWYFSYIILMWTIDCHYSNKKVQIYDKFILQLYYCIVTYCTAVYIQNDDYLHLHIFVGFWKKTEHYLECRRRGVIFHTLDVNCRCISLLLEHRHRMLFFLLSSIKNQRNLNEVNVLFMECFHLLLSIDQENCCLTRILILSHNEQGRAGVSRTKTILYEDRRPTTFVLTKVVGRVTKIVHYFFSSLYLWSTVRLWY